MSTRMTRGSAPGDRDLARAQQRHAAQAHLARGDGRELGVEVGREREDAAHDRVGVEPVALEQLAHQLLGGVQDRLRLVGVDRGGAAKSDQPHGGAPTARLPQLLDLHRRQPPVLALLELAEPQRPEAHALERDHRMADRLEHPPHLPLAALVDGDLDAVGREPLRARGGRAAVVELDAGAQRAAARPRARARAGPWRGRCAGPRSYGCVSRCASAPSSVSRISPVVSASSRPTGYSRRALGTSETIVGPALRVLARSRRRRAAC